jgi:hypothetical protein
LIDLYCLSPKCRHQAALNVDNYPDHVPVHGFAMACTNCGIIGADARPAYDAHERG